MASDDWWQTGVVYQVYPRSFGDSDGDGIGDLAGIIDRLDHLRGMPDSLGVDAIWLSPIYPSPDFDFGYDVADYTAIDPRFGTLETFGRLVDEAHRRGLRIILDLVLNHTSHLHPWFVASRASREGEHADWYVWAEPRGWRRGRPIPPNNWRSWFGGSAWEWDATRGQFYLHTFLPEQPELNWWNPEVKAALLDVARTWLDRGADGFRLDVFNLFYKDRALRSNPRRFGGLRRWDWQHHLHDRNQPELMAALRELRSIVDERPGRMTVGEPFDSTLAQVAGYTEPRHLNFDFKLLLTPWDAARFRAHLREREAAFGPGWPAVVLSNHDQPRHASRFDDGINGDARAKVAAALLLTLRGTPFLYYGEEIALRNIHVPNAQAIDPAARRATLLAPFWNRDQARAPMPWERGENGGFSTGRPWLPIAPDMAIRNVAAQRADPDSVLSFYRSLLALRAATPALHAGSMELVDVGQRDVLGYVRRAGSQAALVLLNFAARSLKAQIAGETGVWRVALSTHRRPPPARDGSVDPGELVLQPTEALILLSG